MIKVEKAGLFTTVQDLGREGLQKYGIVPGGAMDRLAHRLANILVGNEETAATVEMTLQGANFEISEDVLISVCGADFSIHINGSPARTWRPIYVTAGSHVAIRPPRSGCRAYLAVAGGIDVPPILGSRSTDLRAGLGGISGRVLQKGDQLPVGKPGPAFKRWMKRFGSRSDRRRGFLEADWSCGTVVPYKKRFSESIRVIGGRQFFRFTAANRRQFLKTVYQVTPESDRMGYRLKGEALQVYDGQDGMISEPVTYGTIQVPGDGQPIVLMADRQTTGGYPKIAEIISCDLPIAAQLRPGDKIRFTLVSLAEAQSLYRRQEEEIRRFRQGVSLKLRKEA